MQHFFKTQYGISLVIFGVLLLLGIGVNNGLWLSSDSLNYVSLSRSIAEGDWYVNYDQLSTVWPMGYPTLITVIYSITGNMQISLILIQVLLALFFYGLFEKISQKLTVKTDSFAPVLLFSLLFTVLLSAWSELLFINILLGLILVLLGSSKYRPLYLFILLALLVETRFIGVFMAPVIAVFEIWSKGFSIKKSLPGLLCLLAVPAIFLLHYLATGSVTGSGRGPNQANELKIIGYALTSFHSAKFYFRIGTSLLILFALFQFVMTFRKDLMPKVLIFQPTQNQIAAGLIIMAALGYFGLLTMLRLITHFDMINFRLMAPATAIISLLLVWMYQGSKPWLKIALWTYVVLALTDQVRTQMMTMDEVTTQHFVESPQQTNPDIQAGNAKLFYCFTGIKVSQQADVDTSSWTVYNGGLSNLNQIKDDDFAQEQGTSYSLSEWAVSNDKKVVLD